MKGRLPILLLPDLSYQTHRACHAFSKLQSMDGQFTGGLFGFIVTVAKIIRDSQADKVVVCADVKPYLRSEEYPLYKLLRRASAKDEDEAAEARERVKESMALIREFLDLVGIPIVGIKGFEADDVIGHFGTTLRHRFHRIYAGSNDSDLYQLLDMRGFRVWRKDSEVVDAKSLMGECGLTPYEFMQATALTGTHNDVEGIKGVALKTAAKILKDSKRWEVTMSQHRQMYERNLKLIKLPHAQFPRATALPERTREFNAREFIRWCAKFDINVTQSMVAAYEQGA